MTFRWMALSFAVLGAGCTDVVGRPVFEQRLSSRSFAEIRADSGLLREAVAYGAGLYGRSGCDDCHGDRGQGVATWCPPLNDDEWIWGGADDDIAQTIRYGVRQMRLPVSRGQPLGSPAPNTRYSIMPRFDSTLDRGQIAAVASYVRAIDRGEEGDSHGRSVYETSCASCHGRDGEGNMKLGAPRLRRHAWIQQANPASLEEYIAIGGYYSTSRDYRLPYGGKFRQSGMPEWLHPLFGLREGQVRAVTLYLRSLSDTLTR